MTVVDNSVWIDRLNGRPGPEVVLSWRALEGPDETIVVGDRDFARFAAPMGLRLAAADPK